MLNEIHCTSCQEVIRVPQKDLGKRIRCPHCGNMVEPKKAGGIAAATQLATAQEAVASAPGLLASEANFPLGETHIDVAQPSMPRASSKEAAHPSAGVAKPAIGAPLAPAAADGEESPTTLPGYQILEELGRGGMGKVYLARQKSLDRLVALKVMHPRRAKDPAFVARFMREAYAAAQLVHHNIVQIYDIGAVQGMHFFAMEYVKGETLTDLVRREGKLDPEVAAGYILQAARGLKFGHDLGMVHRDVKPDNLLLNDLGIIKVADLGLVKVSHAEDLLPATSEDEESVAHSRSTQMTRVGVGVGTPAYMAPEQARDATHVDARADIYALGCTLYALLAGQPPFLGKTAAEMVAMHAAVPFVPTESYVKRVPKGLAAIVAKMLAKKPADRFANMAEVIAALERFLGIQQAAGFTAREEHVQLLERSVNEFNQAPHARLRSLIMTGFLGGCGALLVLSLLLRWLAPAGALLGLVILAPLAYFLVHGWRERTFLYLMTREWLLSTPPMEALYAVIGTLAFLLALYLFDLLWLWLIVGVVAAGLAVAFHFLIDRRLAQQRKPALDRVEKLLRNMRLRGLDERAVQHFICKYSGKDWEEIFECLFGYPAKLKARSWLRGESAQRRRRFAAWRDPLVLWIDARLKKRKKARERAQLQTIEAKALTSKGINPAEAEQQAAQVANVMVAQAEQVEANMGAFAAAEPTVAMPVAEIVPVAEIASALPPAGPPAHFQKLLETALNPDTSATFDLPPRRDGTRGKRLAAALVGARCRFLCGAILSFCCIFWVRQNRLLEGDGLSAAFSVMIDEGSTGRWDRLDEPLAIPLAPAMIRDLFNSFNVGIAGLLLLIAGLFGGWKPSLIAWPAAGLMFLGSAVLPALGPVSGGVLGLLGGFAWAVIGLLLLRRWRPQVAPPAEPEVDGQQA